MPDTYFRMSADGLLTEANNAADYAARMRRALRAAGVSSASLAALDDALADAFSDAQAGIDRALDGGGLLKPGNPADQIDLSELGRA